MSALGLAYGSDDDIDDIDDDVIKSKPKAKGGGLGLGGYGSGSGSDEEDVSDAAPDAEDKTDSVKCAQAPVDETVATTNNGNLPPRPSGSCNAKVEATISQLISAKRRGMDLNRRLRSMKAFRNPSIYEKLIETMDIQETGSNCPPELYNPGLWGPDDYSDKLEEARRAADLAKQRARAAAARPEIQFERASGSKSLAQSGIPGGMKVQSGIMNVPGRMPATAVNAEAQRKAAALRADAKRKAEMMLNAAKGKK